MCRTIRDTSYDKAGSSYVPSLEVDDCVTETVAPPCDKKLPGHIECQSLN